jgi:hypothetical protein
MRLTCVPKIPLELISLRVSRPVGSLQGVFYLFIFFSPYYSIRDVPVTMTLSLLHGRLELKWQICQFVSRISMPLRRLNTKPTSDAYLLNRVREVALLHLPSNVYVG